MHRTVSVIAAAALGTIGLGLSLAHPSPAAAGTTTLDNCDGINDTGGLATTCEIVIVNTLTDSAATTGSTVSLNGGPAVPSGNLVTNVTQCNATGNGAGGTLTCTISVTNNVTENGAIAATGATVNQCVGSGGPPGALLGPPLPGSPDPCTPFPANTLGATITQCNGSASGGGLVPGSTCSAAGTITASLPVTVNQCNGSVNGGGSKINCSVTMSANVIDTSTTGTTTTTTSTTSTTSTTGGSSTATPAPTTTTTTTATPTPVGTSTTGSGGTGGSGSNGLGSGAGGSAGGASNLSNLAFTGLDVVPLLVGGSGLIGAGLLLLGTASAQRRRQQSAS